MSAKPKEPVPGFEKAMGRIEEIVAEMEGGQLPLERMIADFEEGNRLIQLCTAKLNEVEKRIEKLVKEGDAVRTEPLDAGAAEDDGRPGAAG